MMTIVNRCSNCGAEFGGGREFMPQVIQHEFMFDHHVHEKIKVVAA